MTKIKLSMTTEALLELPEAFNVDLDTFLSGEGEVDEDNIFAKDFQTVLEDMRLFAPSDLEYDQNTPALPSLIANGYTMRHVDAGILLFCPEGKIVGGYLSCDVSIDRAHQDQGLGTEIIIERCLKDGMNPVLHLDEAAYSSAGLAAHISAWERVRSQPEETAIRTARLSKMNL